MSLWVGRLDLVMSVLETFGNIAYGLKNRFDRLYLANVVYFAVTTTQFALKFKVFMTETYRCWFEIFNKVLEINIMIILSKL
jgi:hypothetical protein